MRHTTRDTKTGKFCKTIDKCLGQFTAVDSPKCSGKVCYEEQQHTVFIDNTEKIPYIRGKLGDVFYVLTDAVESYMRAYRRFEIDGKKFKEDTTYKLADIL